MRPCAHTQKNGLKPWLQEHWCIPEASPAFVAAMEDVLDLYAERYDRRRPVVGFDERRLQLLGERRAPVAAAPGRVRRIDYEYRRNGTGNVFTTVEPLAAWRHVEVTSAERHSTSPSRCAGWWTRPDARVSRVPSLADGVDDRAGHAGRACLRFVRRPT